MNEIICSVSAAAAAAEVVEAHPWVAFASQGRQAARETRLLHPWKETLQTENLLLYQQQQRRLFSRIRNAQ